MCLRAPSHCRLVLSFFFFLTISYRWNPREYTTIFYSCVDGCSSCFQFGGDEWSFYRHMCTGLSADTCFHFSWEIWGVELLDPVVKCKFTFIRNCQTAFQSGRVMVPSCQQGWDFLLFQSSQHSLLLSFNFSHSLGSGISRGFNLHFPSGSWCWAPFSVLVGSSLEASIWNFHPLLLGCLLTYSGYDSFARHIYCKYSPYFYSLSFHFLTGNWLSAVMLFASKTYWPAPKLQGSSPMFSSGSCMVLVFTTFGCMIHLKSSSVHGLRDGSGLLFLHVNMQTLQ